MKETIKKYWEKFRTLLKPKDVQPLSAEYAQALSYYGKKLSYNDMIKKFHKEIYDNIRTHSRAQYASNYVIEDKPTWIKGDSYVAIIKELKDNDYYIKEIPELHLLIIYWNCNNQ